MRANSKLAVGLYGLLFHAVVVAVVVAIALKNRAAIEPLFWAVAVPSLLVAAFVVYALAVSRYVARRDAQRKGVVFFDALVGMAAEPAIVALTALGYGLFAAVADAQAGAGYLGALGNRTAFGFLYAVANFMTQILVIGNAAGLVGFVVLKKLAARSVPATK
jgi:hypothetical protein